MTLTSPPTAPAPPGPVDTADPRFYDDPWATYTWLRDHAPMHYDERSNVWVLSRHDDIAEVSRQAERYVAGQGVRPLMATPLSIIAMDDPEHNRQRRLISLGFTPRTITPLTDHIRELSRQCVADIQARGEVEFVHDFAIHVPMIVIAELMGLDAETRRRLYHWSDDMMAGDGHFDPNDPVAQKAGAAFSEYTTACQALIDERRLHPTDDIIGILTEAKDDGALGENGTPPHAALPDGLEDNDLLMFLTLLVVAGNETTRNALAGGLIALSRFPDQRDKLIAHPELIDTAVEEIVRFISPVLSFMRTVAEPHQLHGVDLDVGDRVLMLYQAANRDERVFDEPDQFRVDRDPNPHLGFGLGTHYCLGANLARIEIKIVFQELLARLPDIRVPDGEGPTRWDSALVMAIDTLPAVFTAVESG